MKGMIMFQKVLHEILGLDGPQTMTLPPHSASELAILYWRQCRCLVHVCCGCGTVYECREKRCVFCDSKEFKRRIYLERRVLRF